MAALVELNQTELTAFERESAAIAEMREQYMPLTINGIDDREGFATVHKARMVVKNKRVEVEKRRKELKADALEFGRKVDGAAKLLTELLKPIEEHLDAEESAVVQEKQRIAREAEEAKARKLQERVTKMLAVEPPIGAAAIAAMSDEEYNTALASFTESFNARNAEAARVAAEEAEAKRQEAIRMAAEREALEAERKRLAEIERQQKAEADRIAAEQRKIDEANRAEQKRIADAEVARLRAEEIEREKAAAAERARIETEARLKREAEAAAAKAAKEEAKRLRLEALRPDREKLLAYIAAIEAVAMPQVSEDSRGIANNLRVIVKRTVTELRAAVPALAE
jgi:hypothetical protein